MFDIAHILIGLGLMACGVLMVKFTFWILNVTGQQQWLEKYTGSGSTYGMYKLFGVFLVIVGILFATGFGTNVIDFLFSPLKSVFHPLGN